MQTSVQYRGPSASASPTGKRSGGGGGHHNNNIGNSSSTDSTASTSSANADHAAASKMYPRGGGVGGGSTTTTAMPQRRRRLRRRRSSGYGLAGRLYKLRGLAAMLDSADIVNVALAGLCLFLLSVVVLYRAVSVEGPDPTDELPVEVGGSLRLQGQQHSFANGGHVRRNSGGLFRRMRQGTRDILDSLPFAHKVYPRPCPESMDEIGDKTGRYYDLRQEIDQVLPVDPVRTKAAVEGLRKREYGNMRPEDMTYDVNNCPLYPPEGYPHAWPILDVVTNWKPDDPAPRPKIYQGLCVFDYETELEKAKVYQAAEVPFLMRDDPSVLRTAERWNHPNYMSRMLDVTPHRTEYSPNNHFMYWNNPNPKKRPARPGRNWPKPPEGWTPPTKLIRMEYDEWLRHANTTDDNLGPDKPHWYYRLIGCGLQGRCDKDSSEYLYDELPFFQPRDDNFYMVEPQRQKGIHCRFGMKGVTAENHFDGSRNSIALLGGERRYILSHPDQCRNLALYPKAHPSARHSAVDWSDPDLESYPEFRDARANEVVLQAGDVLYLPTNWFHFIVSLELNFQCNTRSGISGEYMEPIKDCGF